MDCNSIINWLYQYDMMNWFNFKPCDKLIVVMVKSYIYINELQIIILGVTIDFGNEKIRRQKMTQ